MTFVDSVAIYILGQQSPVPVGDIARGLAASSDGINLALNELIKRKLVKRCHHTDAILRYGCTAEGAAHAQKALRARRVDEAIELRRQLSGNGRKVIEALARASSPLSREALYTAMGGELTREQLMNVLSRLRRKGHVLSPRTGTRGSWSLTNPAQWVALLPDATESYDASAPMDIRQESADESREPAAGSEDASAAAVDLPKPNAALPSPSIPNDERLVQLAQHATAGALESLAAAPERSRALVKVAAANALLVEAHAIVRQECAV